MADKYVNSNGTQQSGLHDAKIDPKPKVIAQAEIIGGGPASVAIRFGTRKSGLKRIRISRGDLLDLGPLMKRLSNEGCVDLPFDRDQQRALQKELITAEPTNVIEFALSTGWVRNRFVLPDKIVGQRKSDRPKIAYEHPLGKKTANYDTSGTLEEWKENVAGPAGHSTTMTFAICLALAATLLDVCGIEGGGVHLTGKSSKGKSNAARVAKSVSGRPELNTWSATINGIEDACCANNDGLMCIDETGELEGTPEKQALLVRQAAFKIASGVGKLRAGNGWSTDQSWRLFVISSGEHSLEVIAAASGGKRLPGEISRFPNIPCPSGKLGVFETLPGPHTNSLRVVQDLKIACKRFHGTPLRAFLRELCTDESRHETKIRQLMEDFYKSLPVGEEDGWERRFAEKFALAAAAGQLAVEWEIVPWTTKKVLKAVRRCYRRARKAIPETDKIIKQGLNHLAAFIADAEKVVDLRNVTSELRDSFVKKSGKGFLRDRREYGLHLVVLPKVFKSWFAEPRDADLLLQELRQLGRLKTDEKRNVATRQVKLWPGDPTKRRYLVITLPEGAP